MKKEGQELRELYFALGKPEDIRATRENIARLVQPWYSVEELFDTKVDLGFRYIDERLMPPDVKKTLKSSKPFWDWFNAMWHISERKLIKAAGLQNLEVISRHTYETFLFEKIMQYNVNEVVMRLAQDEAKKLEGTTLK